MLGWITSFLGNFSGSHATDSTSATECKFYVRTIQRRYTEAIELLERVLAGCATESSDLDELKNFVLGDQVSGISVYGASTMELFDLGQATAAVAATFGSSNFSPDKVARYKQRMEKAFGPESPPVGSKKSDVSEAFAAKCITVAIPVEVISQANGNIEKTPMNNLGLFPASDFHYDIDVESPERFTSLLASALKNENAAVCVLNKADQRTRAAIVLAHSIHRFGDLDQSVESNVWQPLKTTGAEQLDLLRALAGAYGIQRYAKRELNP